jgi:hypothetical protein
MKLSILLFAGAVLCSTILRAADDITVSNFGSGYGAGSALGIDIADGASFIAPSTGLEGFVYALSSLEVVAYTTDPAANPASLSLYDSVDGLPNNALETLPVDLSVFDPDAPLSSYLVTVNSITAPHLEAGHQYWVVLSDPLSFDVTWISDGDGTTNPAKYVDDEDQVGWTLVGDSYNQGAFSLDAGIAPETVPEPGTFLGLGSGLAAIALFARRRGCPRQASCSRH